MTTIAGTRFIELSHPLRSGMAVAPGLPSPRFEPYLTREASRSAYGGEAEFEITRLFLVGNTGTSLDSPYHRHADGLDVASLPLETLMARPGMRLDGNARTGRAGRGLEATLPAGSLSGCAVLFRTGWDRHWGAEDYWLKGPFLSRALVDVMVGEAVALVGVDFANVDDPSDQSRPAHTRLLAAGIPIIENLRGLARLPKQGFRLYAVPLAIEGAAALPVRVLAELSVPTATRPDPQGARTVKGGDR